MELDFSLQEKNNRNKNIYSIKNEIELCHGAKKQFHWTSADLGEIIQIGYKFLRTGFIHHAGTVFIRYILILSWNKNKLLKNLSILKRSFLLGKNLVCHKQKQNKFIYRLILKVPCQKMPSLIRIN